MKTITLQEAYDFIANASAIILDDDVLMYPNPWMLNGDADNEWLYLKWDDEEGYEYSVKFIEEEQEIKFDGTNIYMLDSEGDKCKLTLLVPMKDQ